MELQGSLGKFKVVGLGFMVFCGLDVTLGGDVPKTGLPWSLMLLHPTVTFARDAPSGPSGCSKRVQKLLARNLDTVLYPPHQNVTKTRTSLLEQQVPKLLDVPARSQAHAPEALTEHRNDYPHPHSETPSSSGGARGTAEVMPSRHLSISAVGPVPFRVSVCGALRPFRVQGFV